MTIPSTLDYKIVQFGKTALYTSIGAAIGHSTDSIYAQCIFTGLGYVLGIKEYVLDNLAIANGPKRIKKAQEAVEKEKRELINFEDEANRTLKKYNGSVSETEFKELKEMIPEGRRIREKCLELSEEVAKLIEQVEEQRIILVTTKRSLKFWN